MAAAAALQLASSALLDLGLAWLAGSRLACRWLEASPGWPGWPGLRRADRLEGAAVVLGLVALAGTAWSATALMADLPLGPARAALGDMLRTTALGHGLVLQAGLLVAAGLLAARLHGSTLVDAVILALLAAAALARAAAGHAGSAGPASLQVLIQWVHLCLVGLWVGGVAVAGWLVLPAFAALGDGRPAPRHYLRTLSKTATVALAGIVASGVVNAVLRVGDLPHLHGNPYADALWAKIALVGAASALGAFNRFEGFPALLSDRRHARRVQAVLRLESAFLLGALAAASWLAGQEPPAAG